MYSTYTYNHLQQNYPFDYAVDQSGCRVVGPRREKHSHPLICIGEREDENCIFSLLACSLHSLYAYLLETSPLCYSARVASKMHLHVQMDHRLESAL
jgi:hypothetical protein